MKKLRLQLRINAEVSAPAYMTDVQIFEHLMGLDGTAGALVTATFPVEINKQTVAEVVNRDPIRGR